MEKTWDDFYKTGKVTDYLDYRNSIKEDSEKLKEQKSDGTGSGTNGYGSFSHAYK